MKTLEEKIVKILDGINEPPRTNYEIADEILELLKSEREKLLERIRLEKFEILKGNKYKKGKEEGLWVQTNYALGYNQAIADLENLKNQSKKNYDLF